MEEELDVGFEVFGDGGVFGRGLVMLNENDLEAVE